MSHQYIIRYLLMSGLEFLKKIEGNYKFLLSRDVYYIIICLLVPGVFQKKRKSLLYPYTSGGARHIFFYPNPVSFNVSVCTGISDVGISMPFFYLCWFSSNLQVYIIATCLGAD